MRPSISSYGEYNPAIYASSDCPHLWSVGYDMVEGQMEHIWLHHTVLDCFKVRRQIPLASCRTHSIGSGRRCLKDGGLQDGHKRVRNQERNFDFCWLPVGLYPAQCHLHPQSHFWKRLCSVGSVRGNGVSPFRIHIYTRNNRECICTNAC